MAQEQVQVQIAVDVTQCYAHPCLADPEPIVGRSEQHGVVLEGAVAAVHPELVRIGVVRDVDVGATVVVEVGGGDAQAGVGDQRHTALTAVVHEAPAAFVEVEDVRLALKLLRAAVVDPPALHLALAGLVPLDVASHVEVEPAVEIRVEEHRRRRPCGRCQPEFGGRVGEAAAAFVPVEDVGAEVRYVQVQVAVVVHVTDRGAHAVAGVVEPGAFRRVDEAAARSLQVEAVAPLLAGDRAARVREVEV